MVAAIAHLLSQEISKFSFAHLAGSSALVILQLYIAQPYLFVLPWALPRGQHDLPGLHSAGLGSFAKDCLFETV